MPYGPTTALDFSALGTTEQVVTGRAGVFYGMNIRHDADVLIDVYDGTSNADALIWTGKFESTTGCVISPIPAYGVSFTVGLFLEVSVSPDKGAIHFA